jgi:hypothetical protein
MAYLLGKGPKKYPYLQASLLRMRRFEKLG